MTSQRILRATALMTLWLLLPAWLSATRRPHRAKAAATATLRVSNNNPQTVYVVLIAERRNGWAQWPLGTLEASSTRTFRVNRSALDVPNVRIVASAFSNWQDYKSRRLTMRRGTSLDLTLNNPEPRSLLAMR